MLDGFPTRAAWALCTFAYCAGPSSTEPIILFEGRTDGKIVPARGPPKFGWDPVFEAEDTGLTYVSSLALLPADRPSKELMGVTWT
jgi:inosine triphosphate pyrophosphatase